MRKNALIKTYRGAEIMNFLFICIDWLIL